MKLMVSLSEILKTASVSLKSISVLILILFVQIMFAPFSLAQEKGKGCYYLYQQGDKKGYVGCLTKACDNNVALACSDLGALHREKYFGERIVPADNRKTLALFEKACAGNNCASLSSIYEYGDILPIDLDKAMKYAIKGCDANENRACDHVLALYFYTDGGRHDYSKMSLDKYIFELSKRACEKTGGFNSLWGCAPIGNCYDRGVYVTKDETKAYDYFVKDCDKKGATSCGQLVKYYEQGKHVKKDKEKADYYRSLYKQYAMEKIKENTPEKRRY